jgi:hypothetical protein
LIEQVFAKLKTALRKAAARTFDALIQAIATPWHVSLRRNAQTTLQIRAIAANHENGLASPAPPIHGESNLSRQIYGETQETSTTRMEDVPEQPRRWDRVNGFDDFLRHLYCLLILSHRRRQLVWLRVTAHPTAEWLARQVTEARS